MRRAISAVSALAVASVLPFVAASSSAAPAGLPPAANDHGPTTVRSDNRPHPLATQRNSLRQRAVDELVSGDASLTGKGQNRTIQMADGTEVDYPVTQSAELLTFLVDFGDGAGNPSFPEQTAGPLNNEIPEPEPSDNSTYWKADFNRQHYLDMFFNGMPEQDGESFKDLYDEMSSGAFDLEGDVSDWVTVDHPASYYSAADGSENQAEMTNFIGDSADAWYDAALEDMSPQEVKDYLADYDVWDRYDIDGDGNINEPDGYIDHFQAIHAGEGEEAGADKWAIWSHRWAANIAGYGTDGPAEGSCEACFPVGGVEVGDSGYYIYDYTTEPENGGLGVFAHEFGHDLGLPDYYDTGDGDNGTGFWNLMSAGSWLGHGEGTLGTTPGHMGATEKLFLGWYGPGNQDLATVDGLTADPQTVTLGASYHATTTGKQAVLVNLPDGRRNVSGPVGGSSDGDYLYSGARDATDALATSPSITLGAGSPSLSARVSYDTEADFDYGYLQVSDDGGATWDNVATSESSATNPNGSNLGNGITGSSGGWVDLTADLSAYAGDAVQLRWDYITDDNTHGWGIAVDDVAVGGYSETFTDPAAWTLGGFHPVVDNRYLVEFTQYYLAENRQYKGYDRTLETGPYSWGYPLSAPNKADQFPYQDGLLVWYSNGFYSDNNSGEHAGGGANLPVDAGWQAQVWRDEDGIAVGIADGRQQAFDSTFDVDRTDGLSLTKESTNGDLTLDVPARQSTPVFEDADIKGYLDDTAPPVSNWYSTRVAGVGTEIQVISSDEPTGRMVLKVGGKFVAALGEAGLTGTAQTGQTLTATAPAWFQTGVTTTVAWLRDGTPIAGATGTTYEVQAADVGHTVAARVTGAKAGYTSTSVTSSGVPATQAGAPTATTAPKISGTARVGKTLTVTGASWSKAGTSTYAWSVNGTAAGTGTSYTVKPADAGKKVTVTESFASPGYAPVTATAQSGTVAKAPVSLSVKTGKAEKGKKVSVTIRATSPGLAVPGKVKVRYAGKDLKAVTLKNGKATVKLPGKKKGSYKLTVSYLGATGFDDKSKSVTVKVK